MQEYLLVIVYKCVMGASYR